MPPHFESKEERSFSLAKEVTTRARARLAPWSDEGSSPEGEISTGRFNPSSSYLASGVSSHHGIKSGISTVAKEKWFLISTGKTGELSRCNHGQFSN